MTLYREAYDRLDQYTVSKMQESNSVGMSVALTDRDELLRVSTFGISDLAGQHPVTQDTLYEIGSIGKTLTSVLLLQQHEEGRLDLHAPVTRYLPWFTVKSKYEPITIHHLMAHTAGIIDGTDIAPNSHFEVFALREAETMSAPGERFYYSDLGYKVLGFLLEELLNQPYGNILQSHLLDPLDMTKTHAVMTFETRTSMAKGYRYLYDDRPAHPSHPLVPATWHEYGTGDGSPAATPEDMANFVRMLLNRGRIPNGNIISEKTFDLMTRKISDKREGIAYGYGVSIREVDGRIWIGHGGNTLGYSSLILADMMDGLGVVVFMNGPGDVYDAFPVGRFALRLMHAILHHRDLPSLPPPTDHVKIKNAADYKGSYRTDSKILTFLSEGEQLILEYDDKRFTLERRDTDSFYTAHPDFALFLLEFQRDAKGQVVELFYGSEWYTNDRYRGPISVQIPEAWKTYLGHYRSHNPWRSNFRVIYRKGILMVVMPSGQAQTLVPMANDTFSVGASDRSPERLAFDSIVNDRALRASFSGCPYYRTFTP